MKKKKATLADARRMIFNFATHRLGHRRNGLKLREAIRLVAEYLDFDEPTSFKDEWIIALYKTGKLPKGVFKKQKNSRKREYEKYLTSKAWKDKRIQLFILRGKKCERCPQTKYLHVHHKHYQNIFNEQMEDLEVLCRECHKKEHEINKIKK